MRRRPRLRVRRRRANNPLRELAMFLAFSTLRTSRLRSRQLSTLHRSHSGPPIPTIRWRKRGGDDAQRGCRMKTLATTGYERAEFEHVRLYRDDLDRIIGLMSASGLKVRLCDAYFEYESLDEFAEKKGESPRRFQIEVLNEREFDIFSMSYRSRMWLIEADPDMSVLYLKITDLLRERQSRFSRIPVFSLLFCCIGLDRKSVV